MEPLDQHILCFNKCCFCKKVEEEGGEGEEDDLSYNCEQQWSSNKNGSCGPEIPGDPSYPLEVSFSVGATAQISCSHGVSLSDLILWYNQSQGTAPRSILLGYSDTDKSQRVWMTVDQTKKSTELFISKVEMADAGTYHCAARHTLVGNGRGPEQKRSGITGDTYPLEVFFSAGGTAKISCRHGVTGYPTVFWYSQSQGAAPHSILLGSSDTDKSQRLWMTVDKLNTSTELFISKLDLADAGVYYCAASDTVVGRRRRPEQKLTAGGTGGRLAELGSLCRDTCKLPDALSEDEKMFLHWTLSLLMVTVTRVLCKEEKISQDPLVEASEGKEMNLTCRHPSAFTNEDILWYRQFLNQGPRFLVTSYKGRELMKVPKGALIVAEDRKSSILSISRVALEDSAAYFCALSDTVLHSGAPTVQEAFPPCPG
ncbi:hypothetical protein lerEdw1_011623 [Lerista edwardsae]|nr:hypothetical protein lerEdw1_011623 [Lerista edwardsae]